MIKHDFILFPSIIESPSDAVKSDGGNGIKGRDRKNTRGNKNYPKSKLNGKLLREASPKIRAFMKIK